MMPIYERYRNDATLATLVAMLRKWMYESHTTPSELREAVMVAAYLNEIENPRPIWLRQGATADFLLSELRHSERMTKDHG